MQFAKRDPDRSGGRAGQSFRWIPALVVIGFSTFYFADVLLRASEKYFWYDELVTVYLCRLPTLQDIHEAVLHATDFNPPLFYIITRASEALFGEGQIATRVPEILGFWVLCISLFVFVNRRAGIVAGFMAMILPMLTQAYYYAYEARPHGMVMGFAGLALFCWQTHSERSGRRFWLIGLSLCLLGAFMSHCYALVLLAPFGIAELFRVFRTKRFRWGVWIALVIPTVIAFLVFVPLLRSYTAGVAGTLFGVTYFQPSWWSVMGFYLGFASSCLPVVFALAVLLALERIGTFKSGDRQEGHPMTVSKEEIVLACGFLALPLFGVLAGRMVHGPFIARYFMSTCIGFCLLMSLAAAARGAWTKTSIVVLAVMLALLAKNSSSLVWHRLHGKGEKLYEAGTGILLETTPGQPLRHFDLLVKNAGDTRPVAILWTLDFLYLTYYAPKLLPHLHYVSCSEDPESIRAIHVVREWTRGKYNRESTCGEFIASHPDFIVYGYMGSDPLKMIELGAELKSFKMDVQSGKFLSQMTGNVTAVDRERALPVFKPQVEE